MPLPGAVNFVPARPPSRCDGALMASNRTVALATARGWLRQDGRACISCQNGRVGHAGIAGRFSALAARAVPLSASQACG